MILAAASGWGGNGFKVLVNGKEILHQERAEGQVPQSATVELAAGETATVVAELQPRGATPRFGLGIAYLPELISAEAREMAAKADVVVIAAGFNPRDRGRGP